jgi:hypothetical protein
MRRSIVSTVIALVAACSPAPIGTSPPPVASPVGPASMPVRSPSLTPSVTPAATPTVSPSLPPASWTEAFGSELAILDDVVAGPPGLIAAGCRADPGGNCVRALLLTSPDGVSWGALDLPRAANTLISRVRRIDDRWFALGYRIDNTALAVDSVVWASLDGLSWSTVSAATVRSKVITDVISSPDGTLAIGINAPYASEGSGFVTWHVAPDGSFGEPSDALPSAGPAFVLGATWTGDGFLAWGPGDALGVVPSTVLMTSPRGRTWTVEPKIRAFRDGSVQQIIAVDGRLVAVGFAGSQPTSPRAWTSADGAAWTTAAIPSAPGAIYTVRVEGSLLVARGNEPVGTDQRSVTWTSNHGDVWIRLPAGEDIPDITGFRASNHAVVGARVCVAGTFSGDPREPAPRAAIYCR